MARVGRWVGGWVWIDGPFNTPLSCAKVLSTLEKVEIRALGITTLLDHK